MKNTWIFDLTADHGWCGVWMISAFPTVPPSEQAGNAHGAGREHSSDCSLDQSPADPRDIHHFVSCSAYKAGVGRWESVWSYSICLHKSLLFTMKPSFPGGGRAPACPWKVLN